MVAGDEGGGRCCVVVSGRKTDVGGLVACGGRGMCGGGERYWG